MNALRVASCAIAAFSLLLITACSSPQKADSGEAAKIRAEVGGPIFTLKTLPRQYTGKFGIELTAQQWELTQKNLQAAPPPKGSPSLEYGVMMVPMPGGGAMIEPLCPASCTPMISDSSLDADPRRAEDRAPAKGVAVSFLEELKPPKLKPGICAFVMESAQTTIGGQTAYYMRPVCTTVKCSRDCSTSIQAYGRAQNLGCSCLFSYE